MNTASIKQSVDDLGHGIGPKLEEAKEKLGRINGRVASFIQDHPAACLLGALALGYFVARIARHQQ